MRGNVLDRLLLATGLLAASLGGAGCGGGGGGISHAGYVARADAICASAQRAVRSVDSAATGAAALGRIAPIVRREVSQLQALPRPRESRARSGQLDRFLNAEAAIGRGYAGLARAARQGDGGALATEEAALSAIDVGALAPAYGLTECGRASTVVPR